MACSAGRWFRVGRPGRPFGHIRSVEAVPGTPAGSPATATALVRRTAAAIVQRDHSDATSGGATTKTAVPLPKGDNWNARDIVIGTVRRKPIEGLTTGNIRDDEKLGDEWGGEGRVSTITAEKAAGKAIVLLPEPLGAAVKTVDVMVYLHGLGIGLRQRIHSRQKTIKGKVRPKQIDEEGMQQGTVRDIEVDHLEEQLGAVNAAAAKANGRPMVAVMPQGTCTAGRGRPQFGENFVSDSYLDEVWSKIPALKNVARGRAVLAGHSGAGGTLAPMLGRAVDDRGQLKSAADQEAGGLPKTVVGDRSPVPAGPMISMVSAMPATFCPGESRGPPTISSSMATPPRPRTMVAARISAPAGGTGPITVGATGQSGSVRPTR